MVVTSQTRPIGSVHYVHDRERGWDELIGWDAIGGDGIDVQIVRGIASQLKQIQIERVSEQYVGGGGGEGGGCRLRMKQRQGSRAFQYMSGVTSYLRSLAHASHPRGWFHPSLSAL